MASVFGLRAVELALADRRARRLTFRWILVEYGLTILLIAAFLAMLVVQVLCGLRVFNDERRQHGEPAVSVGQYLTTGHFLQATSENWESEFLQMAAFVWLTSCLFQKGSPESQPVQTPHSENQ